jgi:broad specificity phosphatase PhoE
VQLVLVRHGVTEGADGVCMGHRDLPLAAHGRPALERLAAAWRDDAAPGRAVVPAPTRLVVSDLARARASAEPLADAFGLTPAFDARLREMHFGAWEGRAWSALEAEDGERLGRWMAGWATEAAPEGEAFPDVARARRGVAGRRAARRGARRRGARRGARRVDPRAALHAHGLAARRRLPRAARPRARDGVRVAAGEAAWLRAALPQRRPGAGRLSAEAPPRAASTTVFHPRLAPMPPIRPLARAVRALVTAGRAALCAAVLAAPAATLRAQPAAPPGGALYDPPPPASRPAGRAPRTPPARAAPPAAPTAAARARPPCPSRPAGAWCSPRRAARAAPCGASG